MKFRAFAVIVVTLSACSAAQPSSSTSTSDSGLDARPTDAGVDADVREQMDAQADGTESSAPDAANSCDHNGWPTIHHGRIKEREDEWLYYGYGSYETRIGMVLSKSGAAHPDGIVSLDRAHDFSTCQNCMMIGWNCTDPGYCEHFFLSQSGQVEINRWDAQDEGRLSATFRDVKLQEVRLDDEDHMSPVQGGQTWCIDEDLMETEVDPHPAFERQCDRQGGFSALADETHVWAYADGLEITAVDSLQAPVDMIKIRTRVLPYANPGVVWHASVPVSDWDWEGCRDCMILREGCDAARTHCQRTFVSGLGGFELQSNGGVGSQLKVTLHDIALREATIDEDDYLDTDLVAGGQGWCLDGVTLDATIERGH